MKGLKNGSKGKEVGRLQKIIGAKADERFGPITEGLLKSFQKLHGLKATGEVDEETDELLKYEEARDIPTDGNAQRVKLGVVIGHTKKAKGAKLITTDEHEYDYNTELANLMVEAAAGSQVDIEIYTRDAGGISGAYGKAEKDLCDAVIELHFNSTAKSKDSAAYTLTLVSADNEDRIFGQFIQDFMSKSLGRTASQNKKLSVLGRGARGSSNVHSFQGANCLVEPGFGNNPADAKLLDSKKKEYAAGLVAGVSAWAQSKGLV